MWYKTSMKRQWSAITGSPITTSENGKVLGRLNGVFMNPETGQIIAFLAGLAHVISPIDIEQWQNDYIQIKDKDALVTPEDILRIQEFGLRRTFLNTKTVRSKSGKRLGKVHDFTIETRLDSIISIDVSRVFLWWEWNKRTYSYMDISEVTESAIILRLEPDDPDAIKRQQPAPQVS